jgi:ABC-type multidrug transport system fused ATPase/permease subunit
MEEGRVVETATHHELMARRGHYHALIAAQTFATEQAL